MNDNALNEAYQNVAAKLKNSPLLNVSKSQESQNANFQKNNLSEYLKNETKNLTRPQKTRLTNEFLSFGPVEELLCNEDVTEIIINSPTNIWFEREGEFHKLDDQFYSNLTYTNFIHKLCRLAGIKLNLETPCVNGQWNNFRLHLIQPPLVKQYTNITLRRHPTNPWDISKLINTNWASEEHVFRLADLLQQNKNVLIIGPTGSGKTSVLNALLQTLPKEERIICIEDTSEIRLPNCISTKLLTRNEAISSLRDYSQSDLLKEALRMRPNRIMMGEIRGAEAKDYILALSTGHPGSMATLHASDPQQALWRLELLVQLGAPYWNIDSIRGLINLSVDYIVHVGFKQKKRQLLGIYRVASLERHGFTIESIFKL